jgi:hypothetical protein
MRTEALRFVLVNVAVDQLHIDQDEHEIFDNEKDHHEISIVIDEYDDQAIDQKRQIESE